MSWAVGDRVEDEAHVILAFDAVGEQRLGTRAPVLNGRGQGALRKIGAVRGLLKNGRYLDEHLWSALASD